MIHINEKKEGYFNGDKCIMTGKKDSTKFSFVICEFEYIEGRLIGEKFWQPENSISQSK